MLNLLKNMNRRTGVGQALPFGIFNLQNTVDGIPARGPLSLPGDGFNCVNKPQYGCPEEVEKAGTVCSRCRVRIKTLCFMPTLTLFFEARNV